MLYSNAQVTNLITAEAAQQAAADRQEKQSAGQESHPGRQSRKTVDLYRRPLYHHKVAWRSKMTPASPAKFPTTPTAGRRRRQRKGRAGSKKPHRKPQHERLATCRRGRFALLRPLAADDSNSPPAPSPQPALPRADDRRDGSAAIGNLAPICRKPILSAASFSIVTGVIKRRPGPRIFCQQSYRKRDAHDPSARQSRLRPPYGRSIDVSSWRGSRKRSSKQTEWEAYLYSHGR